MTSERGILTYHDLVFLFTLKPATDIVSFFLNYVFNTDAVNVASYFLLVSFLYLVVKLPTYRNLFILLFIYFSANVFFFNGSINNKAREVINFILVCALMISFRSVAVNHDDVKRFERYLLKFAYVFVVIYFITVALKGVTYKESYFEVRGYLDGFIISHSYAYYITIIGFYFLYKKFYIHAAIILSTTIFTGTRSGLILIALVFTSFYFRSQTGIIKKLFKLSVIGVVLLTILFSLRSYSKPLNDVLSTFDNFSITSFSLVSEEQDSVLFTAGRSVLWFFALEDISDRSFSTLPFYFGKGPLSAEDFNEERFDLRIWMHNDFIHILFCYGLTGLILYIYSIVSFVRMRKAAFLLFFVIATANINGFFKYDVLQLMIIITLYYISETNTRKPIHRPVASEIKTI